MDPRIRPEAPRQYEEFEPKNEVVSDEGAETILLYLPAEFKREHLRVQLTASRILRIIGERPLGGNKWVRFMKEVSVPPYCDAKNITAKLENGVLSVRQAKLITPSETLQPKPAPAQARPSYVSQMLQERENLEKKEKEAAHKNWVDAKPARGEAEADTGKKHEQEMRDTDETGGKPAVAEGWTTSGRVFKEMKKPDNLMLLAVVVVVAMAVALQVAYINKVCGPDRR